eukprot:2923546-Pleurochrysis_carterae.AAC.1
MAFTRSLWLCSSVCSCDSQQRDAAARVSSARVFGTVQICFRLLARKVPGKGGVRLRFATPKRLGLALVHAPPNAILSKIDQ